MNTDNVYFFVICTQLYRILLLHFLFELIKIIALCSFKCQSSHDWPDTKLMGNSTERGSYGKTVTFQCTEVVTVSGSSLWSTVRLFQSQTLDCLICLIQSTLISKSKLLYTFLDNRSQSCPALLKICRTLSWHRLFKILHQD